MDLEHLQQQIKLALAQDYDKMLAPLADIVRRFDSEVGAEVKEVFLTGRLYHLPEGERGINLICEAVVQRSNGSLARGKWEINTPEDLVLPCIVAPIVASLDAIPDTKLGATFFVDYYQDPVYDVNSFSYQLSEVHFNFTYSKAINVGVQRPVKEAIH